MNKNLYYIFDIIYSKTSKKLEVFIVPTMEFYDFIYLKYFNTL